MPVVPEMAPPVVPVPEMAQLSVNENGENLEREIEEAANAEMEVHGEIVVANQNAENLHAANQDYTYNDLHSDTGIG